LDHVRRLWSRPVPEIPSDSNVGSLDRASFTPSPSSPPRPLLLQAWITRSLCSAERGHTR
jgi:hypothetical protein